MREELNEAAVDEGEAERIWASLTTQCEQKKPCIINNSESCQNKWNDYKCNCKEGFIGKDCEQSLNTLPETTRAPPTEAPRTEAPQISEKSDKNGNFDIICDGSSMSVKLRDSVDNLSQQTQMKSGRGREVHLERLRSASNCPEGSKVQTFGQHDYITMSLSDDCFVEQSFDENYMYYRFQFLMKPEMDSTSDSLVIDWGTYWMATCKYYKHKQVSVEDGNGSVVSIMEWREALRNNQQGSKGYDFKNFGEDENEGNLEVQMQISKDYSYNQFFGYADFPLNFRMGDRLFSEINFVDKSLNSFLSLTANNCWAQPSKDSMSRQMLITDRCSSNDICNIESNQGKSYLDRFSSQVFKFPGQELNIYIKCQVEICNSELDCSRTCANPSSEFGKMISQGGAIKRNTRTLLDVRNLQEVTSGRITLNQAEANSMSSSDRFEANLAGASKFNGFTVGACVVAVLAVMALLANVAYKKVAQESAKEDRQVLAME